MRAPAILLVVLVWLCSGPAAASPFEEEVSVPVVFRTDPPGAQVLLLGLPIQTLGVSGHAVQVSFPKARDETLSFRFQLKGYRDFDYDISTTDLRGGSGGEEILVPYDRVIPLTPLSPLSPIQYYVETHKAGVITATAVIMIALLGVVLPYRRRIMRQSRKLRDLIPLGSSLEDQNVGGALGRWLLVRLLGRGGCAAVYEGVPMDSLDASETVAIKVMHGAALSAEFKDRFAREVNICRSLDHPNLVRLLDWEQGENFYLVMELVQGRPLRGCIPPQGMSVEDTLHIMAGVFSAIGYAHQMGVVHCDLKPENIMITHDERVRVMDFGIATGRNYQRLTTTTNVLGTPGYIAPEQMDGVRDDGRSDQYAIGVILFEMLTGAPPFDAPDPILRLTLHLTQEPPRVCDVKPSVSPAVSDVVNRMLAKAPHNRFATMQDAWGALVDAARVSA